MKELKQIIKFQSSIFFSMKIPSMIFLGVYGISLIMLIYFTYLGMPFSGICHTSARFIYYICVTFTFVMYYYLIQSQKNSLNEVVEITKQSHFKNTVIYMLMLIISWNLFLILILLLNAIFTINQSFSILFALKNYLYNCMLPQIILIIISILTAKMDKENLGFVIFAIFIFLTGPFFGNMSWRVKPDLPIDIIINIFTKPFQFFYQNGEVSPDILYGLQFEDIRIIIFVFWLLLFITVYQYKKVQSKKKLLIPIFILSFLFIQIYKDRNLYRMSMDYKTAGYTDLYNYGFFDGTLKPYKNQKEINYKISHYQMDIELKDKLYVSANLDIQSDKQQQEYVMTLYRGYKVKKIKSDMLESFQQKDDQLIVKLKDKYSSLSLNIVYQGYHPKYYSNECACLLPGYFPWYPMAGEKQIFVDGYGMNPYNRIESCQMDINIKSNYPFVTNLKENGKGYSGVSDSLTIIGGHLKKVSNNSIQNILPLEYIEEKTEKEYLNKMHENLNKMNQSLKDIYQIDLRLNEKIVIIASKDLERNYTNNSIAIFNDYILCSNNVLHFPSYQDILRYCLTTPNYQGIIKEEIIWSLGECFDEVQSLLIKNIEKEIESNEQILTEWNPLDDGYEEVEQRTQIYKRFYPYVKKEKSLRNIIQWLHDGENDESILLKLESGDSK